MCHINDSTSSKTFTSEIESEQVFRSLLIVCNALGSIELLPEAHVSHGEFAVHVGRGVQRWPVGFCISKPGGSKKTCGDRACYDWFECSIVSLVCYLDEAKREFQKTTREHLEISTHTKNCPSPQNHNAYLNNAFNLPSRDCYSILEALPHNSLPLHSSITPPTLPSKTHARYQRLPTFTNAEFCDLLKHRYEVMRWRLFLEPLASRQRKLTQIRFIKFQTKEAPHSVPAPIEVKDDRCLPTGEEGWV